MKEILDARLTVSFAGNNKIKKKDRKSLPELFWSVGDGKNGMSEAEKQRYEAGIRAKLASGKRLSAKELEFLRRYNPALYMHAIRVQRMAEAVEEQLKRARSKEEANQIIAASLKGVSDKDPDREAIIAAIEAIAEEFRKSPDYARLPNTTAEANRAENRKKARENQFGERPDGEDDVFGGDLMDWSPLQDVIESLPTFRAQA